MSRLLLTRAAALLFLILVRGYLPAHAQAPSQPPDGQSNTSLLLTVDLADPRSQNLSVALGTYSLRLRNALPGIQYSVTVGPAILFEQPELPSSGTNVIIGGPPPPPPNMSCHPHKRR